MERLQMKYYPLNVNRFLLQVGDLLYRYMRRKIDVYRYNNQLTIHALNGSTIKICEYSKCYEPDTIKFYINDTSLYIDAIYYGEVIRYFTDIRRIKAMYVNYENRMDVIVMDIVIYTDKSRLTITIDPKLNEIREKTIEYGKKAIPYVKKGVIAGATFIAENPELIGLMI